MSRNVNKKLAKHKTRRSKELIPRTIRPKFETWDKPSMPPELDVRLPYTSFVIAGSGVSSAFKRFNPNSYIPEFGGTAAAAEFVQYAGIYDFYRVVRFKVEFDLVNQDTTTAVLVFLVHNEDFNGESLGNLSGNPFAVTHVIGSSTGGASRARYSRTYNVSTLVGSDAPETADSYRALINANPADVIWAGFGLYGAGTMTNGISGTARITQWIRFYNADLTSQTTAPSVTSKQQLDAIQDARDKRKLRKELTQFTQ